MIVNTSNNPIIVTSMILTSIGAINWGLVGIADFNIVSYIFGTSAITKIIYVLVGLGGVHTLFNTINLLCTNNISKTK